MCIRDREKTVYVCTNCWQDSPKWVGKCPSCGEWNTYVEEIIRKEPANKRPNSRVSDVQEIAGHGVQAVIDGKTILAGNTKLMEKEQDVYKRQSLSCSSSLMACQR